MARQAPLILIMEDNAITALDLELSLRDRGYRVLGPAASVARGLELLVGARPDFAVLDFDLGGEPVTSVALQLRRMDVPFVLASAHRRLPDMPAFDGISNLGKPISQRQLLATIADHLRH